MQIPPLEYCDLHIYGRDTLVFAVQGITRSWKMRQGKLSGRPLSHWDELPTVT
jgi:hypothetical protein